MSIATELQHYNNGLLDAYAAVNTMGGTVPTNRNLDNLPAAISSIPSGGTDPTFFGCDEGVAEMNYLEDIMPEILTIHYGGLNIWL